MTVANFFQPTSMHRLTRLDEIFAHQPFYFLTFCTWDRTSTLANPSVHASFRRFSQQAAQRQVFVGRYVIMPDHIHFFAAFTEPDQLSSWMKSLKNSLSKSLRDLGIHSPHWQKGYFDHLMRNEDSYGSKWDYVHQNPVRQNLVSEASAWPYQGEINLLPFN
jgi:REP-associated tyrosine transposase